MSGRVPVRILIADDHQFVRRGVRSLLEQSGAAEVCGEASNGREALQMAKALKPELVIMDVSMPEMNGLDATREIVRELPGTPVLFLTQHDSGEMLRLAIKSGGRGYVVKSSLSDQLLLAIEKLVRGEWFLDGRLTDTLDQATDSKEILQRSAVLEMEIRESEERLRSVMDSMVEGLFTVDSGCRATYINPAAEKLLGWARGELIGMNLNELILGPGADDVKQSEVCRLILEEGREFRECEHVFLRRDGTSFPVVYNASPLRSRGAITGIVLGFRDDSARKESRENEQRFRTLADNIPSLAWISDEAGRLYWINRRLSEFAGAQLDELNAGGWARCHHPEYREGIKQRFYEAVRQGTVWEDTFPLRRHDGKYRWFLSRAVPVRDEDGKIVRWFGLNTDITEQREAMEALRRSEERFELLVNCNLLPMTRSADGRILEANEAYLQLFGYTEEELRNGEISWRKLTPPEYWEAGEEGIDKLRVAGVCPIYEKEYFHKDGTRIPILIGAVTVNKEPLEYLTVVLDIRETKRVNDELRQAQAELERRVNERTRELATAMAALRDEILFRAKTEERLRELSAKVLRVQDEERRRIARDLHDSAGQTLAALKMSLGALRRSHPEIEGAAALKDATDFAESAIREIRTTSHLLHPPLLDEVGLQSALQWFTSGYAERSGVDVSLKMDSEMSRLPAEYELCLFRLVQECLTNIHRHSGSKSATVDLDRREEYVRLEVVDQGKGMPEEIQKKIIAGENPGVGLRGMRERIRQLGGKVSIQSNAKGTTVSVVLPLFCKRDGQAVQAPDFTVFSLGSNNADATKP